MGTAYLLGVASGIVLTMVVAVTLQWADVRRRPKAVVVPLRRARRD